MRHLQPPKYPFIPITLFGLVAAACTDQSLDAATNAYGTVEQELSAEDVAESPSPKDGGFCGLQPEPRLMLLSVGVEDSQAVIAVESTVEDSLSGLIQVHAETSQGRRTMEVPIELAGLASRTITIGLDELGVDPNIELAILTGRLSGDLANGTQTFALTDFVYDRRKEKPELEDVPRDAALERITVATVSDGIAPGRGETHEESLRSTASNESDGLFTVQVNKTICFDSILNLANNTHGEDVWTGTPQIFAIGQRIDAKAPGASSYSTWWLDPTGCISGNFATGTWTFRALSQTRAKKGTAAVFTLFDVRRESDNLNLYNEFTASVNSSAAQTIVYTAGPIVIVAHATLTAVNDRQNDLTFWSFPGTLAIKAYAAGISRYDPNTNTVYFTTGTQTDKWVLMHEMGHFVQIRESGNSGTAMGYDTSLGGVLCSSPANHSPQTREFTSASDSEGFANYWAALLFNNKAQSDCWTRFAGWTISCAGPSAAAPVSFTVPFMETNCNDGSSFNGHGNETDWQRTYWNLTRGDTPGTVPSVFEVLQMLNNATGFGGSNHYQVIDAAAALPATPNYLESRWDAAAATNGIDH